MSDAPNRTRTYTWVDPIALAEEAIEVPGDEIGRFFTIEDHRAPISSTLDFAVTSMHGGVATAEMVPSEFHYNPIGLVHGGVACTLIDTVTGCAVQSLLPAGVAYTTLNTNTNFLRPMTKETGKVVATATVVKPGRKVMLATAEIRDENDKLIATGESTCLVLPQDL